MKRLVKLFLVLICITSCNFGLYNQGGINYNTSSSSSSSSSQVTLDENKQVVNVIGSEGLYTDKVRISWDKMKGADIYIVERYNLKSRIKPDRNTLMNINVGSEYKDDWTNIGETIDTAFIDDANLDKTTYYAYRVTAKSLSSKKTSKVSNPVLAAFLTPPNDMEVSKGQFEDKIEVTFTETPGANAYELYVSTDGTFQSNSQPVATIANYSSREMAKYEYKLKKEDPNLGKQLYFALKSVSSGNNPEKTDFSESKTGFTYTPGAPQQPDVTSNKGEDTKTIRISFKESQNSDGETSYVILRSISGGAETEVAKGDEILFDEGSGDYYYEDTNVESNFMYTYSVYGTNSYGPGQAMSINAYLFSPVQSVTLTPNKSNENFGYSLNIVPPLGYSDEITWEYEITNTYNDSTTDSTTVTHNGELPFYHMEKTEQTTGEIRTVSVKVIRKNTDIKTREVKAEVKGVPEVPVSFTGSKNVYDSSVGANKECPGDSCDGYKYGDKKQYCTCIGVYPIILRWAASKDAENYRIEKYSSNDFTPSSLINEIIVNDDVRYNDKRISIGKKYSYRLYAEDALGRSKGHMEVKDSYGAITARQFASEFERHIAKPWEFQDEHPDYRNGGSKGRIWSLIRQQGTGSLGSGDATDDFLHGKVSYNASLSGVSGSLKFRYTEGFGEKEYIHIPTRYEMDNMRPADTPADTEDASTVKNTWSTLETPQGYNSTVGMSGSGDYVPLNNQTFYISGWYGDNEINMTNINTTNYALSGTMKVTMRYNTLDGKVIKVEDSTIPPLSYKVVN